MTRWSLLVFVTIFGCKSQSGTDTVWAPAPAATGDVEATEDQTIHCMGAAGWRCPKLRPHVSYGAGARPDIFNPSWGVTTWWWGPGGSDSNDCASSGTPCATKLEITSGRWGCTAGSRGCPRLRKVVTINQTSTSETTDSDPGYLSPTLEQNAALVYQCQLPAASHTGSLTAVTSPTRTTTASGALQRFTDSVGPFSWPALAFTISPGNVSGTTWATWSHGSINRQSKAVQHLTSFPSTVIAIPEVSPAVNDTYSEYNALAEANLVRIDPVIESSSDAGASPQQTNQVQVVDCSIYDPNGVGVDPIEIGQNVSLYEVNVERSLSLKMSGQLIDTVCDNCQLRGGVTGGRNTTGAFFRFNAGRWVSGMPVTPNIQGPGVALSGDIQIQNSATFVNGVALELVYIGDSSSDVLSLGGFSTLSLLANGYTAANTASPAIVNGAQLYGPGKFNVVGNGSFGIDPQDAGQPGQNQLTLAGPNQLNGQAGWCCLSGSTIFCNGSGVAGITIDSACTDAGVGCGGPGGNASCFSPSFGGANVRTNIQ